MKLTLLFLTSFLFLCAVQGEEQVGPEPVEGQIVVRPGFNAVAITRLPLVGQAGGLAETLTLPLVFGQANEAGLRSGGPATSDLVWIATGQGKWTRFFYGEVNLPGGEATASWQNVDSPGRDASGFEWPYTAGMLIERRLEQPLIVPLSGAIKRTPTVLPVQTGTQYFNRVLDGPMTLAELQLEKFFLSAREDLILEAAANGQNNPSPMPGPRLEADQFLDPASGDSYVLSDKGQWYVLGTRNQVDPNTLLVPGTFGIERLGERAEIVLTPSVVVTNARPAALLKQPFLGLNEGAVRALRAENLGPPECTCAFLLHGNRPIALHVIEAESQRAIVRVGKHPDDVVTDSLGIANGRGVVGKLEVDSDLFRLERAVRSFSGSGPAADPQPYVVALPNPERREGEQRFFSQFDPEGRLVLLLAEVAWVEGSLIEIDLIAVTPDGRKIALHVPRVRLLQTSSASGVARELARLVRLALIERELVPDQELRIQIGGDPARSTLTMDFGLPLQLGKIDLCLLPPPPVPEIESTSDMVAEGSLIEVRGKDFGNRIEDLCLVLAPTDGVGSSIPLRPVSLSPDGTRILARVAGPIADGRTRRVMLAKGIGRTRPIHLGVPDVIVRQGVWVWRGNGASPVVSPIIVRPVLAQGETMHFTGSLDDGSLELKIDEPWPENGEVSISFTANTESVQLDSYAPELCFTVSGSAEECAERLQRVLEAAFVQGGMANGNQVQVELNVDGDDVTLTADVFTEDGVREPITSGHLNVSVSEGGAPCAPPAPDDSDGDLMEDSWETDTFEMEPPLVDAFGDPDGDAVLNLAEFAFATDPFMMNAMTPLTISLDEQAHPVFVYQRHVAAPNYYHFDIETSLDGAHWERLANVETLSINPVALGLPVETIVTRCLVGSESLSSSFFRLRLSPRS